MRKLIIFISLLLIGFGAVTSQAMNENTTQVVQAYNNVVSLVAGEVSLQPPPTAPRAVQYKGSGPLRGWMYHFPPAKYTVMSINAKQYLEGDMGYRGDGDALALSFLEASEDDSCVQSFTGLYPGLYGRTDWLIWTDWTGTSTCDGQINIRARTTLRNRTYGGPDVWWQLFGGTQDFNLAGHGRGIIDRRICFGGLLLSNSQMFDCTTPGHPSDGSAVDPAVRNSLQIPVYDYDDDHGMWEWLIRDHPHATVDKTIYYMAYLPVPVDANNNRLPLGFIYGAPDNHWGGFTINYLPYFGTACTQTRSGRAYVRARVFMVADVPYRDSLRPWAPGNIVANPGTDTIDILIVAKEMISFGVEHSISPGYFADEIKPLGGGSNTEVYALTLDPQDSTRSLFLASMNRTSTTCSFATPTDVNPTICDGEYTSMNNSDIVQHKYYHRRPEQAMWSSVVLDTTGAYHQIACNY